MRTIKTYIQGLQINFHSMCKFNSCSKKNARRKVARDISQLKDFRRPSLMRSWNFLPPCRWQVTNANGRNYTNINGIIFSRARMEDRSRWRRWWGMKNCAVTPFARIPERPRWREDLDKVEEEDGNYAAARTNVIIKWNRDKAKAGSQGSPNGAEWKVEN